MGIRSLQKYSNQLTRRGGPGRPRKASEAVRENNYNDAEGNYAMVGGLKPWHKRIVDYMLAAPHAKKVDIAREFGVTPQWIGRLMESDAFREYYSQRMDRHQDEVHDGIVRRLQSVAIKSLDVVEQKLQTPQNLSLPQVRETAESALKALGYTNPAGQSMSAVVSGPDGSKIAVRVGNDALQEARLRVQDKMKDNSKGLKHDPTASQYVTEALDVKYEAVDVEDAIDVTPDE